MSIEQNHIYISHIRLEAEHVLFYLKRGLVVQLLWLTISVICLPHPPNEAEVPMSKHYPIFNSTSETFSGLESGFTQTPI